jgi:hypothetical protein
VDYESLWTWFGVFWVGDGGSLISTAGPRMLQHSGQDSAFGAGGCTLLPGPTVLIHSFSQRGWVAGIFGRAGLMLMAREPPKVGMEMGSRSTPLPISRPPGLMFGQSMPKAPGPPIPGLDLLGSGVPHPAPHPWAQRSLVS